MFILKIKSYSSKILTISLYQLVHVQQKASKKLAIKNYLPQVQHLSHITIPEIDEFNFHPVPSAEIQLRSFNPFYQIMHLAGIRLM